MTVAAIATGVIKAITLINSAVIAVKEGKDLYDSFHTEKETSPGVRESVDSYLEDSGNSNVDLSQVEDFSSQRSRSELLQDQ